MQKQMYKVHQPHRQSGYLTKVQYEATTDEDGLPDWLLHYTPGPKAKAEYAAFMCQPGADAAAARTLPADADQDDLLATVTREPPAAPPPPPVVVSTRRIAAPAGRAAPPAPVPAAPPTTPLAPAPEGSPTPLADPLLPQAEALVQQFYQRFHGLAQVAPTAKELTQATTLLTTHGLEKAQYLLTFSHQAAQATQYQPQVFGGILHYTDRALAAYDAQTMRTTQATAQLAAADERPQREQYLAWEHQQLAHLRAALPAAALTALEAEARDRLVAEGAPAFTLPMGVRAAVDEVLAAQAGLPTFEAWREHVRQHALQEDDHAALRA